MTTFVSSLLFYARVPVCHQPSSSSLKIRVFVSSLSSTADTSGAFCTTFRCNSLLPRCPLYSSSLNTEETRFPVSSTRLRLHQRFCRSRPRGYYYCSRWHAAPRRRRTASVSSPFALRSRASSSVHFDSRDGEKRPFLSRLRCLRPRETPLPFSSSPSFVSLSRFPLSRLLLFGQIQFDSTNTKKKKPKKKKKKKKKAERT